MSLVRLDDVSLEFGDQRILRGARLTIEAGERICLIGRNGAGKTSLFRLITGALQPDRGEVLRAGNVVISELEQTLPGDLDSLVRDHVTGGIERLRAMRDEYQRLSARTLDDAGLRALEELHGLIEAHGGWHVEQRVETVLSELGLPADARLRELSGGWRRRVALARALVSKPDLLLLDEPTNHLDLSAIEWLENRVRAWPGSVLFITHDRAFLRRLATRIVEIDRGRLTSWPGDFDRYLALKDKALADEAAANALFDKRLAGEEAWIRQGVKARRTRNEGRVRALLAMREQAAARIRPEQGARVHIEEADPSGRKVITARRITHAFGDRPLIDGLSLKVMRGDRIGIVGNNGVCKSTLLRILLGELKPDGGTVKLGTNLRIGYFDQMRRSLDPDRTVAETVGDGSDHVTLNGRSRHVIGYLKGFLFSPKRAMTPVRALSGGECNRVILARLFTRPANLLVLDEPTNDLDVETLEVLEQKLIEYQGTLIVVSHDRAFLDNVVTSIVVFEKGGVVRQYAGGYSDWARRGRELAGADDARTPAPARDRAPPRTVRPSGRARLGYRLQRELDRLPARIEALEQEIRALETETTDPAFYDRPFGEVRDALESLAARQRELDEAMARWLELDEASR